MTYFVKEHIPYQKDDAYLTWHRTRAAAELNAAMYEKDNPGEKLFIFEKMGYPNPSLEQAE